MSPAAGRNRQDLAGFTAPQRKAAAALAAAPSISQAARSCGLGERTLRRYATDPAFNNYVETLRTEATDGALRRLTLSLSGAVAALEELLSDESGVLRRQAAADLLRFGLQAAEMRTITQRIDELERRLAE
ncbi:MAG: hypothetical protein JJU29_01160 [Verrucomicrobia bacterium]|nr:hypothetical protein [Verrucomicrobiota bacterium]MCH8510484.1 hypothetical protein [Kiritimatiellia bacterium]